MILLSAGNEQSRRYNHGNIEKKAQNERLRDQGNEEDLPEKILTERALGYYLWTKLVFRCSDIPMGLYWAHNIDP